MLFPRLVARLREEEGLMLNRALTPTKGKATGEPRGRQALRDRVGSRSNILKALCLFDTGPGKS